jgi:UDP-glucose 4-epimerase
MTIVAISGATSYTGMCIAERFAAAGHTVYGLCRGEPRAYRGLKRLRLERAERAGVELVGGLSVEDGAMAKWVSRQTLDVWVHHHHPMERFRDADYDVVTARHVAIDSSAPLLDALAQAGVRALLYSGTYFEPGEGGQPRDAAVTPYAALKHALSESLARDCRQRGIGFGKVVISAPAGAFENQDRLTPGLLAAAMEGRAVPLRSPDSVMDVVSGEALAGIYERAALEILDSATDAHRVYRPSGSIRTTLAWAEWVRDHILAPLELAGALRLEIPEPEARGKRVAFANPSSEQVEVDWEAFARDYARDWRAHYPFG